MSFLGMSYVEILVVALVAFVFLGPERMVDAARKLGKVVRTVREMAADLPSIEDLDLDRPQTAGSGARRDGSRDAVKRAEGPSDAGAGGAAAPDEATEEDGPVAFRAASPPPAPVRREEGAPEDRA